MSTMKLRKLLTVYLLNYDDPSVLFVNIIKIEVKSQLKFQTAH